ncbi:MAG: TIM barrel protein [Eubacteriales bacterium]|jgi:deoxyribonuclease-4
MSVGIHFGPAGNSDSFYAAGNKSTLQMPGYLEQQGLNAYEYQCGRGVKITEKTACALGEKARVHGVALSLHAPYYINLANPDPEKQEATWNYILQSCQAAQWMGAERVVIHSGAVMKQTRAQALEVALGVLREAQRRVDEAGLGEVRLCPETMGKIGQLGDLEEVLTLCSLDERMLPTLDFGHLNARTIGGCHTYQQLKEVLEAVENRLGRDRLRIFHSHFSKIEYTPKGGEKRHLTFADTLYGPEFEPLSELVYQKGLEPTFICESAGTQTEDAREMRRLFESQSAR